MWDYLTAKPSTAGAVTQPVPAALILALRADLTHFRHTRTRDLDPNQGFKHIFLLSKKSLDNKNGLNDCEFNSTRFVVDNDRVFSSLKKKIVKPQQRQQQSTVLGYIVFNEVTVLISRTTMK